MERNNTSLGQIWPHSWQCEGLMSQQHFRNSVGSQGNGLLPSSAGFSRPHQPSPTASKRECGGEVHCRLDSQVASKAGWLAGTKALRPEGAGRHVGKLRSFGIRKHGLRLLALPLTGKVIVGYYSLTYKMGKTIILSFEVYCED